MDNCRITIRDVADDVGISFGSCEAIFTNVLGMKRAAAEIVPKLLSFVQQQRCMDIAQEKLMMFNGSPDLLWWRIIGVWLKTKSNHRNGSVKKSQSWKKHVKFGQMWKFCSLFSSIAMACCIMKSCHWVVRSIRNTTLKLCFYCAKQFVRKGTELWENQSWILHNDNAPAYTSMFV